MAIADTLAADVTPWPSVVGNVGREWALISATERYEAFAIWWSPGVSIDLHDHGDCVGAVAVVAGELFETAVVRARRRSGGDHDQPGAGGRLAVLLGTTRPRRGEPLLVRGPQRARLLASADLHDALPHGRARASA